MIPVSNGHVLRSLNVDRKALSVNVNISTLCGKTGIIKGLAFQILCWSDFLRTNAAASSWHPSRSNTISGTR